MIRSITQVGSSLLQISVQPCDDVGMVVGNVVSFPNILNQIVKLAGNMQFPWPTPDRSQRVAFVGGD